ncbi:hypothetical protein KM043_014691 [Ampulex compressa]|nr:hypothetical protein KM043_014691 [Ampulex compressa]
MCECTRRSTKFTLEKGQLGLRRRWLRFIVVLTLRLSKAFVSMSSSLCHEGDLFGGLNSGLQDGLLSRAEALAADLGKHNAGTPMPLKHDPVSVYHHGAHMPTPHPNNRPHHQVQSHLFVSPQFIILF